MKILIILILIDCYLVTGCKSDRRNFKSHLDSSLSSEALFSTAVPESERLEQVDQLAQISMMSFYERSINVVTDEEFTIDSYVFKNSLQYVLNQRSIFLSLQDEYNTFGEYWADNGIDPYITAHVERVKEAIPLIQQLILNDTSSENPYEESLEIKSAQSLLLLERSSECDALEQKNAYWDGYVEGVGASSSSLDIAGKSVQAALEAKKNIGSFIVSVAGLVEQQKARTKSLDHGCNPNPEVCVYTSSATVGDPVSDAQGVDNPNPRGQNSSTVRECRPLSK